MPNRLKQLGMRRLARQYALDAVTESCCCNEPMETVSPESVVKRMQADGLDAEGIDWNEVLSFLQLALELLRQWFSRPAEEPTRAKK